MARYGMLINTKKCIGCYACRTACQRQNGLDPTDSFIRFEEREVGEYPSVSVEHVPLQCMHCEDAPCASVCPTGAAHIGPDGIVEVDQGRCIGCLYCMAACPYQVRNRNEKTGAVDKCRFCNVSNYTSGTELRDGLSDRRAHLRRPGRPGLRAGEGDRRHARGPHRRRPYQVQSLLREVMLRWSTHLFGAASSPAICS